LISISLALSLFLREYWLKLSPRFELIDLPNPCGPAVN